MRKARLLAAEGATGYYHCISRVVDRRFVFGLEEKEFFVRTLRKVARFHGVKVLTFCVMGNHFHLLLEVRDKGSFDEIGEEEVLQRVQVLYGHARRREMEQELGWAREAKDEAWVASLLDRYRLGMGELQNFMKMLKQRFSIWYNHRNGRKGTLWEERYKSVLVEGSRAALLTCAAYIDLNPVRAGIVEDPKDYRWSGYGEASSGVREARLGLVHIFSLGVGSYQWGHAGREYRKYVFLATQPQVDSASSVKGVIDPKKVREVVEADGRLPVQEILRVRVRYFTDGLALGGREFVDGVFEANRMRFGVKRQSGARRMRGADWGGLSVLRDLRVDVIG